MTKSESLSPVLLSNDNDPEMEQAYKRARKTFRFFWREMSWEMRRIVPGLELACVKVAFSDPPKVRNPENPSVEYMWINQVDFDGATLVGTLVNSPNWVSMVKEGSRVRIKPKRICDWMYVVNGNVYGGHTINLLRSRMSRSERSEHDAAWGLEFGDPRIIELVPPEFYGKKRPGFVKKLLGASTKFRQDPKHFSQIEHPMAINMLPSLHEHVLQSPQELNATDKKGFNILHHHALAGAAQSVDLLLASGANPHAKTKRGLTPNQLAAVLGWKVVQRVIADFVNRKGN